MPSYKWSIVATFVAFLLLLLDHLSDTVLLSDSFDVVPESLDHVRFLLEATGLGVLAGHVTTPILAGLARVLGRFVAGPASHRVDAYRSCIMKRVSDPLGIGLYAHPGRPIWDAFCDGRARGLQLPGVGFVSLPPAPAVSAVLAVAVVVANLSTIFFIATEVSRNLVLFCRRLLRIGLAFLAILVSGIREALVMTTNCLDALAPALFEVTRVLFTCLAIAIQAFLAVAVFSAVRGAEALLEKWDREPATSDDNSRGAQTPDFMPGICSRRSAKCDETAELVSALRQALAAEREAHLATHASRMEAERRIESQDAEISRLEALVAEQRNLADNATRAAEEVRQKMGFGLTARQTIATLRGELASANQAVKGWKGHLAAAQAMSSKAKERFAEERKRLHERVSELEGIKPDMAWFLTEGVTYLERVVPTLTKATSQTDPELFALRLRVLKLGDTLVAKLPDSPWGRKQPKRSPVVADAAAQTT